MNVLVLGGSGQLGHCFQELAQSQNRINYKCWDRSRFDIGAPESMQLLQPEEIDLILNCAAYTQVDRAETEREEAYRSNVTGPALLAKWGKDHDIPLIHFSTDYIFSPATEPIPEDYPVDPVNYYGRTKWVGEEAIRESGVRHLIFRTSWLYSEFSHNFVKTMLRLAGQFPEIKVVDDQTGSPTYARDLASAIDRILPELNNNAFPWGTYHYANRGATTWFGFAREILKNKNVKVRPIPTVDFPTPATRPKYSVLDTSRFRDTFRQEIPGWKESLKACMERMGK